MANRNYRKFKKKTVTVSLQDYCYNNYWFIIMINSITKTEHFSDGFCEKLYYVFTIMLHWKIIPVKKIRYFIKKMAGFEQIN